MLFDKIDRIVLVVRNFDKTIEFFSNAMNVNFLTGGGANINGLAHSEEGFGLEPVSPPFF